MLCNGGVVVLWVSRGYTLVHMLCRVLMDHECSMDMTHIYGDMYIVMVASHPSYLALLENVLSIVLRQT